MSHLNNAIVRLYDTVFNRPPDLGGLAFWNAAADQGYSLEYIAGQFITAPEFAATYGQPTNRAFVEAMYRNVLDRPGEAEGVAFWTGNLDAGATDRVGVVLGFSESPEHIRQVTPAVVSADGIQFRGSDAADVFHGGAAANLIWGAGGDDALHGGPGNDFLHGGDGRDFLSGGDGDDYVVGGPGDDYLEGGLGDDFYDGGPGMDWMVGGSGNDRFYFRSAQEADGDGISFGGGPGGTGVDVLEFYELHLAFRGQEPFVADGRAQLRYEAQPIFRDGYPYSGKTVVSIDADGDGRADASLTVWNSVLTDAAFVV